MDNREKSIAADFLDSKVELIGSLENLKVDISEIRSNYDETSLFTRLQNKLQKVTIDEEELFIVEGDTLLDQAQLEIYSLQKDAANKARELEKVSDAAGLGKINLMDENRRGLLGM